MNFQQICFTMSILILEISMKLPEYEYGSIPSTTQYPTKPKMTTSTVDVEVFETEQPEQLVLYL